MWFVKNVYIPFCPKIRFKIDTNVRKNVIRISRAIYGLKNSKLCYGYALFKKMKYYSCYCLCKTVLNAIGHQEQSFIDCPTFGIAR